MSCRDGNVIRNQENCEECLTALPPYTLPEVRMQHKANKLN